MSLQKRKIFRQCLVVMVILSALLIQALSAAAAGTEGAITGKFGLAEASQVTELNIYEAGTTNVPVSLTSQQEYDIKVTVSNANGIGELADLAVRMWYDADNTKGNEASFGIWADDSTANMWLAWDRATNTASIRDIEGSTWALDVDNCTLPTTEFLDDPENTSFDFVFRVKIGKVAAETKATGSKWHLGAKSTG